MDTIEHALSPTAHWFATVPDHELRKVTHRVLSVKDNFWVKAKTSQARGAVHIEGWSTRPTADQVPWVGAAGTRHEGDEGDFYVGFAAACAGGSDHFLPTVDDQRRLTAEQSKARRHREIQADDEAITAVLLRSVQTFGSKPQARLTSGSTVSVTVIDDGDRHGLLELWLEVPYDAPNRFEALNHAIDRIPGIPFSDWQFLASVLTSASHKPPPTLGAWCSVEAEWIAAIVAVAEQGVQAFLDNPPQLVVAQAEPVAHVVLQEGLTEATVTGRPVRGLCGLKFLQSRDPHGNGVETCVICAIKADAADRIRATIRAMTGTDSAS